MIITLQHNDKKNKNEFKKKMMKTNESKVK
jgi:hypothetical protein